MKRLLAIAVAAALAAGGLVTTSSQSASAEDDNVAVFPTLSVEDCVRSALGIPWQLPVTKSAMSRMKTLTCTNSLAGLAGLEQATGLTSLTVQKGSIEDLTPIAGLTGLTDLTLRTNNISDVTPLAGLTGLTDLTLRTNKISDVTPLAGLTNLERLDLAENNIADVTTLGGLPQLNWLYLWGNKIVDISPLEPIAHAQRLWVEGQVVDFPLVAVEAAFANPLVGLRGAAIRPTGAGLNVSNDVSAWSFSVSGSNKIAWRAPLGTEIPFENYFSGAATQNSRRVVEIPDANLRACINSHLGRPGEAIIYDTNATSLTSLNCSDQAISDLTGMGALTSLQIFYAERNSISDISPLRVLPLRYVYLDDNNVRDVSPLTGKSMSMVSVRGNHIVDVSPLTYYYSQIQATNQTVTLADVEAFTKQSNPLVGFNGFPVTPTSLDSPLSIGSTGWTSSAPGTYSIRWNHTNYSYYSQYFSGTITQTVTPDQTPIITMPDTALRACVNSAIGQSASAAITERQAESLTSLRCTSGTITDLSGIEKLTNLALVAIPSNKISDLTPLAGLSNLAYLELPGNAISDLSPLAELSALHTLKIWSNQVSDISPLAELPALRTLHAEGQDIRLTPALTETAQSVSVTNYNADTISLTSDTAVFDDATGTWSFTTTGEQRVNWRSAITGGESLASGQFFSGTIRQYVTDASDTVVDIPDAALRSCVAAQLGVSDHLPIMASQASSISSLRCEEGTIASLSGLEAFTALSDLYLAGNQITDLTPLANLTTLTNLRLPGNQITDLTPLAGLTELTYLYLWDNQITDISPTAGLTKLTRLWAEGQRVTLPEVEVGTTQSNPLVNIDGAAIPVVAPGATLAEDASWSFAAAGTHSLTWRAALGGSLTGQYFSGTITQVSVDATVPEVEVPEVTEPPVTEVPDEGTPEVTEPEGTETEGTQPEVTEPETVDPEGTETPTETPESTEPPTGTEG